MTFVAAPAQPVTPVADAIEGDGWYPALSIARFRESSRIGALPSSMRVRDALVSGMLTAALDLAAWRAAREAEGIAAIAAVPGPTVAGECRALILWRRIVYAYAAAELVDTHNDISATIDGRQRREQVENGSADEHRRAAIVAVRDLLGRSRSRVSLL